MQPVRPAPLLSDEDYGAIEAAVMETARGRWFLAEYARRNRNADTDAVLAAIRRLERLVQSAGSFEAQDEVTRGMADIAQAIAAAQVMPAMPRGLSGAVEVLAEPVEEEPAGRPMPEAEARDGDAMVQAVGAAPVEEISGSLHQEDVLNDEVNAVLPSTSADDVGPETFAAVVEQMVPVADAAPGSFASPAMQQEKGATVEAAYAGIEPMSEAPAYREGEAGVEPPPLPGNTGAHAAGTDPFPIIELDEEATEALLQRDPPRHELVLPTNHLATQRWSRDPGHEAADVAAPAEQPSDEPLRSGLVTFIDEEPVDESGSVFSAPLRLEPEDVSETEGSSVSASASASTGAPVPPPITIGEIEAMSFARKAALFS